MHKVQISSAFNLVSVSVRVHKLSDLFSFFPFCWSWMKRPSNGGKECQGDSIGHWRICEISVSIDCSLRSESISFGNMFRRARLGKPYPKKMNRGEGRAEFFISTSSSRQICFLQTRNWTAFFFLNCIKFFSYGFTQSLVYNNMLRNRTVNPRNW